MIAARVLDVISPLKLVPKVMDLGLFLFDRCSLFQNSLVAAVGLARLHQCGDGADLGERFRDALA